MKVRISLWRFNIVLTLRRWTLTLIVGLKGKGVRQEPLPLHGSSGGQGVHQIDQVLPRPPPGNGRSVTLERKQPQLQVIFDTLFLLNLLILK